MKELILKKQYPLEAEILREIIKYLKTELGKRILFFERRNSGASYRKDGKWAGWYYQAYFPNKRITAGMPDLLVIKRNFNLFTIEVKQENGKLLPSQQIVKSELETLGIDYLIARNVNEVKTYLEI